MSGSADDSGRDAVELRARRGDWIGVFGSRTSVVLPADGREGAARVWPLVDAGADHLQVLDALLAEGFGDLPDFVLVEHDDDRVRVVVRGRAEVMAHSHEGRVRVRAEDRIWEEHSFVGLVALEVVLPAVGTSEDDFDVRPGIGRVGGVTWGRVPTPVVVPSVRAVPDPPETAPLSATPLTPAWQEEVTSHLSAAEEGGLAALGFGLDEAIDPAAPEAPVPAVEPPGRGHVVALLVFSHGETVAVDGPVLVGRSPVARPGSAGARLVTVPSPHQEVSSTHLEIRPGDGLDLGTAVVTDLGSTNGTVVVHAGLPPRDLRPGQPHALLPGAVIDLGDGATVEVRRP